MNKIMWHICATLFSNECSQICERNRVGRGVETVQFCVKAEPFQITLREGKPKDGSMEMFFSIKCPHCGQRLFDLTPSAAGMLSIKCGRCRHINEYDLTRGRWLT